MKNYDKLENGELREFEEKVVEKLKRGHVLIEIYVDDTKNLIKEIASYVNDPLGKTFISKHTNGNPDIKKSLIKETLWMNNRSVNKKEKSFTYDDINIETGHHVFYDYEKLNYNIDSILLYQRSKLYHYEFYISNDSCDLYDFGYALELDFVREWMVENGYDYQDKKQTKVSKNKSCA